MHDEVKSKEEFDMGYTMGTLHHTPNVKESLKATYGIYNLVEHIFLDH